jgi:hypothetical protein
VKELLFAIGVKNTFLCVTASTGTNKANIILHPISVARKQNARLLKQSHYNNYIKGTFGDGLNYSTS